jgi:hypothetical protein
VHRDLENGKEIRTTEKKDKRAMDESVKGKEEREEKKGGCGESRKGKG